MNAIRIRAHVDSETLHLPELKALIGKDVEIIVIEETTVGANAGKEAPRKKTLAEIAAEQGKKPITDVRSTLGAWPEEERNDGFEEDLRALRKQTVRDLE